MLTSFLAGVLSAVLANAGSATTSTPQPASSTPQPAQERTLGLALTLPGGTWCLGQPSGVRCDHVWWRTAEPATRGQDRPSWHFTLLDRTVCLGEVPKDVACTVRFDPGALTKASSS